MTEEESDPPRASAIDRARLEQEWRKPGVRQPKHVACWREGVPADGEETPLIASRGAAIKPDDPGKGRTEKEARFQMSEPHDPRLSEATRMELVQALKTSIHAADAEIFDYDTWLINAFDIELPEADDMEFSPDDVAAIRDAYEIVAQRASETHAREFFNAFRGRVDLIEPATMRRLQR